MPQTAIERAENLTVAATLGRSANLRTAWELCVILRAAVNFQKRSGDAG